MHNKKHRKSGFTLVEMLIVIVIIGILASALIPRLTSARGRANDVARKADLQQIATALISYQIDQGSFPTASGSLGQISAELTAGGMASIPKDPGNAVVRNGDRASTAGEFFYQPIKKNGQVGGGIVLMASVETEGSANYVICGTGAGDGITSNVDFETVQSRVCSSFSGTTACVIGTGGVCSYVKGGGNLRYIYVY